MLIPAFAPDERSLAGEVTVAVTGTETAVLDDDIEVIDDDIEVIDDVEVSEA
jgi:hypothetical protein